MHRSISLSPDVLPRLRAHILSNWNYRKKWLQRASGGEALGEGNQLIWPLVTATGESSLYFFCHLLSCLDIDAIQMCNTVISGSIGCWIKAILSAKYDSPQMIITLQSSYYWLPLISREIKYLVVYDTT